MIKTKILNKIKNKYFPSAKQQAVKKWYADGGDYAFRFNYDLNPKSVVLDIGGYEGQWASDLFSRYRCNIFIFEPVKLFAERIADRFHENNQIEVLPFGLGGKTRQETIHVSASSSSIFGYSSAVSSSQKKSIEIMDIKTWLEERKLENLSLVKINIEGGEYELLDRLITTNYIEKIDNIQVQFHDFVDNARSKMYRIQAQLEKTHRLTYQYEFIWENWERKI